MLGGLGVLNTPLELGLGRMVVKHVCGDVLRVKDFRITLVFETTAYPKLSFGISIIRKRHKITK